MKLPSLRIGKVVSLEPTSSLRDTPFTRPLIEEIGKTSKPNPIVAVLRLHEVKQDDVGWTATFFGKPDVWGNSISIAVSEMQAGLLKVGKQYEFTVVEK